MHARLPGGRSGPAGKRRCDAGYHPGVNHTRLPCTETRSTVETTRRVCGRKVVHSVWSREHAAAQRFWGVEACSSTGRRWPSGLHPHPLPQAVHQTQAQSAAPSVARRDSAPSAGCVSRCQMPRPSASSSAPSPPHHTPHRVEVLGTHGDLMLGYFGAPVNKCSIVTRPPRVGRELSKSGKKEECQARARMKLGRACKFQARSPDGATKISLPNSELRS